MLVASCVFSSFAEIGMIALDGVWWFLITVLLLRRYHLGGLEGGLRVLIGVDLRALCEKSFWKNCVFILAKEFDLYSRGICN